MPAGFYFCAVQSGRDSGDDGTSRLASEAANGHSSRQLKATHAADMYAGQQAKIMRKLLGKPASESSPSHDPSLAATSSPLPAAYRPSAAQNAVYAAGAPIACLDRSPDGRSALLAGRYILRTVRFNGLHISHGLDLRALITAQSSGRAGVTSSSSDQLSIKDVKWASDTAIFTACGNGRIFQYDLAALSTVSQGGGLECVQMREDSRQINTLDVNPHRGSILLSGSQDGIVRYFDIRAPRPTRTGLTFQAVLAFKCNADGVRHVKWSPKDGFTFACATEQGVVLRWDIRKASAPTLRISAHDRACTSISWHPDGDHLISAGWDNKCYVWDLSKSAERRQKAKHTISTPAPVSMVSWRPGQWSASVQGKRAAQVAVAYDEGSQRRFGISAVHVWDLARPTMPYKEIVRFDSSPSDLLWLNQDLLWTVGQDGLFNQCDVAFAPRVIDRTSVSSMAFSARGEVLMFLDERPQPPRPRLHSMGAADMLPIAPFGSSPTAGSMLAVDRNDSEDDVVGSFLGPRRRAGRKRRASTRSVQQPLSTTPPSSTSTDEVTISLDQSVNITGAYKPQQAMAVGPVPSAAKVDTYHYLSAVYLDVLERELPYTAGGQPMVERVVVILEHYARAAETVGQFRLAQTWRILAYVAGLVLQRRAQYHLEKRMRRPRGHSPKQPMWDHRVRIVASLDDHARGEETPRKTLSTTNLTDKLAPVRSLLSEEIESTSNVATPLVRPVSDEQYDEQHRRRNNDDAEVGHLGYNRPDKKLTPVLESDSLSLPPAMHAPPGDNSRRRLDSMPLSDVSQGSEKTHASSVEGYDFYDADSMARAIDVPHVKKQEPPRLLDFIEPKSPDPARRLPVVRQDSDESFGQIFSLSQTSGQSHSSDGSAPHGKRSAKFEPIAEHHQIEIDSDVAEGEYQSRIRGKQMENSPGSSNTGMGLLRRALERTGTNVTGTTGTTETTEEDDRMITQTTSDSMLSQGYSYSRSDGAHSTSLPRQDADAHGGSQASEDGRPDKILETDYLPWPDDPPYPYGLHAETADQFASKHVLIQPYTILSRALSFETRSSALNASAMVMLLKPLVPDDVMDPFQAAAILKQHHSRLMGMKLFVEAALFRKMCVKGWPGGVLSEWGQNYSSIFSQAQHGVSTGFLCPSCRKPREISRKSNSTDTVWRCERCGESMGPCAICGHREMTSNPVPSQAMAGEKPEDGSADMGGDTLSTWWYCAGCGHGGHSTCMETWHSTAGLSTAATGSPILGGGGSEPHTPEPGTPDTEFSDGCCPMDGCGHACLPGRWRADMAASRSEEITRAVREVAWPPVNKTAPLASASPGQGDRERRVSVEFGGIRGDGDDVSQSRAVESVREALSGDRDRDSGTRTPRRKSVKFTGTEEHR